ncbi:MAG: hypothetical protein M3340_17560, partial [Actinomycetota bacterium]|nr:hypothetical protein [Actinomycetota bacterium]
MSAPLTLEPAGLQDARDDWRELAEASGNPFSTWEWASAWWDHFGGGRALHVLRCRDGEGGTRAILPLFLDRRGPLRMLRFVGTGRRTSSPPS